MIEIETRTEAEAAPESKEATNHPRCLKTEKCQIFLIFGLSACRGEIDSEDVRCPLYTGE